MKYPRRIAVVILLCCAVIMVMLAREFGKMHIAEPIYPGEGVTEVRMLSDYLPQLKESAGDTEIYVLRGNGKAPRCWCWAVLIRANPPEC